MTDINNLINNFNCSDDIDIHEMFSCLKNSVNIYLNNHSLSFNIIIRIIKDLRDYLNPFNDQDIFYFTDIICDCILLKFKDINKYNFDNFKQFVDDCEEML